MRPLVRRSRVQKAIVACALLGVGSPRVAFAQEAGRTFTPTSHTDVSALTKLVLERSPTLQDDRLRVDLAAAERMQAGLWENPIFDASWSTIPIGETNPPGLRKPLANVPNYSVGLSYRFLLGKRGPRVDRAEALERSARASVEAAARYQALLLAGVLGGAASASLRIERLRSILEEGRGSLDVARARMNAGSGTPLEVDRLEIELSRTDQQILSAEGDLAAALSTCSGFLGYACTSFSSTSEARAYLQAFAARIRATPLDVNRRPDIRALDAARDAASSEAKLARAQAIPDPTVRVGYVNDRFTAAGNQESSLNVSVSLPLPFVDRGQALQAAAEARESRVRAQRDRLAEAARARIESLKQVLDRIQRRQQVLETQMLPRARSVVKDLERAVGNRLIPVTDLIQARRTLAELLLEEVDAYGDAFRAAVELMNELAYGDVTVGAGT